MHDKLDQRTFIPAQYEKLDNEFVTRHLLAVMREILWRVRYLVAIQNTSTLSMSDDQSCAIRCN